MRDIDAVIERLRAEHPGVRVEQLSVRRPADDGDLWYFSHPDSPHDVQIEGAGGDCPFLVEEWNGGRTTADTVDAAVAAIETWLSLAPRQT